MTEGGRERRFKRRNKASERRALMRGRREVHKCGLDVRRVGANACGSFGWEAWHRTDVRNNLREFFVWGIERSIGLT